MKQAILVIVAVLLVGLVGTALWPKISDIIKSKLPQPSQSETATPRNTITETPVPIAEQHITAAIDSKIKAANTLTVYDFSTQTPGARDLQFSPGGVLLVSETSVGKVVALPDDDHNGVPDQTKTILSGLHRPHGLAFYQNKLYVAEENNVTRYNWDDNNLVATKDKVLFNLPTQLISRHYTRGIEFDQQGNLYISIGSTCDVCLEKDEQFASVIVTDSEGTHPHIFAKGLRNAVFLKLNPTTNQLWATEMSRDALGNELPADEIDIVKENANYGWPYCYEDKIKDSTFVEGTPIDCGTTESPIYKIPAHAAPLGLTFIHSSIFPAEWQGDLLVVYHGSNQGNGAGFKVVHQNVEGNTITGEDDVITGFITGKDAKTVIDRPADVEFDQAGNLYISNDKAGKIYLITQQK